MSTELLGVVSLYVQRQLQAQEVLHGEQVVFSRVLAERLPELRPVLEASGAAVTTSDGDDLQLTLKQTGCAIAVVVDPAAVTRDLPPFALRSLGGLAWLFRRRLCDCVIWSRLLCGQDPSVLAGETLLVDGYCDLGRVIAGRARGLGMIVRVHEREPERQLEALYDGFELDMTPSKDNGIYVNIAELVENPGVLCDDRSRQGELVGVEDEVTAACAIAAAVLHIQMTAGRRDDVKLWHATCDRLLYDALLHARFCHEDEPNTNWDVGSW